LRVVCITRMAEFTTFIDNIFILPTEVLNEFLDKFKETHYPKNSFLLKEGNVCKHVWLIEKGLVRQYYMDDGRERNTWFSSENSVITDIPSLFNNEAAQENIQSIEDSIIYRISLVDILELQEKHHTFCLWYIKMVEKFYFSQVENRIEQLQFYNATQRYEALLQMNPTFSQRISLGNIASYLNISQETLSRIRARK
jgi:CRP/FNR family transcriptional regulator, anaerobic regulatory protein